MMGRAAKKINEKDKCLKADKKAKVSEKILMIMSEILWQSEKVIKKLG